MKKVTKIFQRYKECARHLRNTYYIPNSEHDWDTLEDFDEVKVLIFKHMVLNELLEKYDDFEWFGKPFTNFEVVPSSDICPIMINREKQSGYWDHPIEKIGQADFKMAFISYFDWNSHDQIDFRYYRVRIIESEKYPELIDFDALIETIYADVFLNK